MTTQKHISARNFDAMISALERMSEHEIETEYDENGENLAAVAAETRALLLAAVDSHQRERLEALASERDAQLESLSRASVRLPSTVADRRELFARSLRRLAAEGNAAIAQFRQLTQMSDDEVVAALLQLAVLGQLDEHGEGD